MHMTKRKIHVDMYSIVGRLHAKTRESSSMIYCVPSVKPILHCSRYGGAARLIFELITKEECNQLSSSLLLLSSSGAGAREFNHCMELAPAPRSDAPPGPASPALLDFHDEVGASLRWEE